MFKRFTVFEKFTKRYQFFFLNFNKRYNFFRELLKDTIQKKIFKRYTCFFFKLLKEKKLFGDTNFLKNIFKRYKIFAKFTKRDKMFKN